MEKWKKDATELAVINSTGKSYMTDEPFLIDTNIFVYAYDKRNEKKKKAVVEFFKMIFRENYQFYVSNQILAELIYVLTSKIETKLNVNEAKEIIDEITKVENCRILNYSCKTVLSAVDISKQNIVPFWVALIIATMLENQVFTIYTENLKDFMKVKQIKVINPFD